MSAFPLLPAKRNKKYLEMSPRVKKQLSSLGELFIQLSGISSRVRLNKMKHVKGNHKGSMFNDIRCANKCTRTALKGTFDESWSRRDPQATDSREV